MIKVTNQFEKVNPETELQKMAKNLSRSAQCILNPIEGMKYYQILTEMQKWYNYDLNYDKGDMQVMVFFMEELRDLFLRLDQYHQLLKNGSKENDVLVEFKFHEKR